MEQILIDLGPTSSSCYGHILSELGVGNCNHWFDFALIVALVFGISAVLGLAVVILKGGFATMRWIVMLPGKLISAASKPPDAEHADLEPDRETVRYVQKFF